MYHDLQLLHIHVLSFICSDKIATECLKKTNWTLEPAINHFYSSGFATAPGTSTLNLKHIEDLYLSYKGGTRYFKFSNDNKTSSYTSVFVSTEKDGDTIQAEGLVRFCEDLGLDPSDIVMVRILFNPSCLGHRHIFEIYLKPGSLEHGLCSSNCYSSLLCTVEVHHSLSVLNQWK
jgi:hypothetical protein